MIAVNPTLAGLMIPADGRGGVETTPPSDLIFNGLFLFFL